MKRTARLIPYLALALILTGIVFFPGCKKTEDPIKFPKGTFPDSLYNLEGLNSAFDDYNANIYLIGSRFPIIFSSNRGSSGGQFNLVQGVLWYYFDQYNGNFTLGSEIESDLFYGTIISKANTPGDDLGPYSIFSSADGYEYLVLSSETVSGDLDLYFLRHLPRYANIAPEVTGPLPVTIFNTAGNESYLSFDANADSAYFSSDRGGNFDIYVHGKGAQTTLETWFARSFEVSSVVDSLVSGYEEKCPFVYKKIMVFASDRPGGMGGFDLYYSIFRNGKWSYPVNMGPRINSTADEYRPLVGFHADFKNYALVFSSNREGGNGGFDLYFTGYNFSDSD